MTSTIYMWIMFYVSCLQTRVQCSVIYHLDGSISTLSLQGRRFKLEFAQTVYPMTDAIFSMIMIHRVLKLKHCKRSNKGAV